MAYFEKRDNGKWRAQVRSKGVSQSKTFASLARAKLWAAGVEGELGDIAEGQMPRKTLGEAFDRYAKEVSPSKRGGRWETIRLAAFPTTASGMLKTSTPLQACSPALLAQWRDLRALEVSPGTILRELSLLSAVFQRCVREWGWMRENPVKAISKPASPAHRDKLLTASEIRKVLRELRSDTSDTISGRCGLAFLFALRTGMRAGEICGIRREHCHLDHVTLPLTKNGSLRNVPLSRKAKRLLGHALNLNQEPVFGITSATRDTLFRRACDAAGLVDVRFHDSRHWAATHLARKLPVVDLCRMFGWKSMSQALTYYNATATSIAALLDK